VFYAGREKLKMKLPRLEQTGERPQPAWFLQRAKLVEEGRRLGIQGMQLLTEMELEEVIRERKEKNNK
jgi:hypothetical protein